MAIAKDVEILAAGVCGVLDNPSTSPDAIDEAVIQVIDYIDGSPNPEYARSFFTVSATTICPDHLETLAEAQERTGFFDEP